MAIISTCAGTLATSRPSIKNKDNANHPFDIFSVNERGKPPPDKKTFDTDLERISLSKFTDNNTKMKEMYRRSGGTRTCTEFRSDRTLDRSLP